jgi:phosphoglycolate phosphatase-like HAD superfamily hydrolase
MRSTLRPEPANQRYSAVIFDFEGTLVDFQWRLAPAEEEMRGAFARLGFQGDGFASGNYATMWNTAADRCVQQGRMDELRKTLYPIYDRWDSDALARWALRPGAAALLRRFADGGTRVGLVSNIGRAALAAAIERFDLGELLSPVISRNDVTYMKPKAEGILRVLSAWPAAAVNVLFVGDSLADVRGARAAGMPVAIISGGEAAPTAFAGNQPDHMISGLSELADLVDA